MESLEQAEDAPGVDPRRKKGYIQPVATIVEEISQAVEKVATLGLEERQVLNDLVRWRRASGWIYILNATGS